MNQNVHKAQATQNLKSAQNCVKQVFYASKLRFNKEKKAKKENTQHVDLHLQGVKIKVKEKNGVKNLENLKK